MKLTKQDIDKVRHIEGFPIAKDEDIIALSRPPYYTACPNLFVEDFIREHGTHYDEATDNYHREPFAADVSEGKNDPIYMAHSYHTKVPYKAIMRYILHYTKPGDIVLDGFCGTGMTGVAAHMCGKPDAEFKSKVETEMPGVQWGERKTILSDLSPAATFIAHNYNTPMDVKSFEKEAKRILSECEKELGWLYETQHTVDGKVQKDITGQAIKGRINYTVWSDVFICPSCGKDFLFWDVAVDSKNGKVLDHFTCNHCHSLLNKRDCQRAQVSSYDNKLKQVLTQARQAPVLINYTVNRKRFEKTPDVQDLALIERVENMEIPYWYPTDELPDGYNTEQPKRSHGITHVHHFYTKLCLHGLAAFMSKANESSPKVLLMSVAIVNTKLYRYRWAGGFAGAGGGPLSGTLYVPSIMKDINIFKSLGEYITKLTKVKRILSEFSEFSIISTQSTTNFDTIPNDTCDYLFTDPPFGANLNYSELSFIWEAWLKVITNQESEAIMNDKQSKGLLEYQKLMSRCFAEYYRVLKPGRWMTVEFHNSKNAVWNAIQESLQRAGFIVADVRTLDKHQGSFQQVNNAAAVKQDLVISAYKPKDSFVRDFQQRAGTQEMVWEFVHQHLERVPITADGNKDGVLDVIAERCDYLLFDRMVAYHIMHGISVPMDAQTFYEGLRQRFLERDGMFFLPDQVTAYDEMRLHMKLDTTQFSFAVTDEKNAIQWLNYILRDKPQTYQDIQPQYLQELHQDKREQMPELLDMLKDNFLQDEQGRFYIPDLSKAADLSKLRTKKLLKEFYDNYVPGRGKLKAFRMEAIRAGFDDCWNRREYKTIIGVGERLPENVLQEDPALLMYYDNACVRS